MLAVPAWAGESADIGAVAEGNTIDLSGGLDGAKDSGTSEVVARHVISRYVPACAGNTPDASTDTFALCSGAIQLCAATPDDGDVLYWRFTAVRSPDGSQTPWLQSGSACLRPQDVPRAAVPAFTVADFRRLPLPKADVRVQPGSGRTLVTVPTNLYAVSRPATFRVTVLGSPVVVRATPVEWTWAYGDGTRRRYSTPGGPYPDLSTAHTWTAPGRYPVSLTTTWRGTYSVAGGPQLPVDGTAAVASAPVALTVVETRAELVADTR